MTDTTHPRTETAYHGHDSSAELEREVDAERNRVSETLDALQNKMSVGNIFDDVVRSFSRYGGDMAGNFGRQVRQNPLPLLLTGVGLAWLMSSSGRARSRYPHEEDHLWDVDDDDLYDEEFVGTRRYGTTGGVAGGRSYGTAAVGGTYRDEGHGHPGAMESLGGAAGSTASRVGGAAGSAAHGASNAAGSAAAGAGSAARGVGESASSAASGVGRATGSVASGVGNAAGSAASGASHAAGSAARGVGAAAGAVSAGIGSAASGAAHAVSSGARDAYDGARSTGESVRDGAYRAGRSAYAAGRSSARRVDDMVHEHPLVLGALALAVGAAIGGALPRTRTEDEYLGEYSDHAKDAARETVEREGEKVRRVSGAVADEARDIYNEKSDEVRDVYEETSRQARDVYDKTSGEVDRRLKDAAQEGRSAADRAGERAKAEATGAAERLRNAAKSEAERQNLGDPKKSA